MSVLCSCLGGGSQVGYPPGWELLEFYCGMYVLQLQHSWVPGHLMSVLLSCTMWAQGQKHMHFHRQIDLKTTQTLHLMQIGGHQAHLGACETARRSSPM